MSVTRRRFARVPVDLPAQYEVRGHPRWHSSSIINIGGGGVRLQTMEDIAEGTAISLRFDVEGTPIVATARIVLSAFDRAKQCYFSSAAFMAIDLESQLRIEQRVLELRASGTA